jgi:hypothetical protein
VRYETLAGGFLGTDQTVARMSAAAMGKYGSKSPKIRALARNIIVQAGVPEKDYEGEARALGKWVRDNIRYLKDPYGQETLSYPEETAFNMRGGDCDDQCALLAALLASVGIPSRFKVMGVTPLQYSHVYLQARPENRWITMDPIMADKPIGWEVPQWRRVIEKVYPTNGPGGFSMQGLGYVGDPRVVSHLDEPTIPLDAGSGAAPQRIAARPAYVSMPSGLTSDADLSPMMAFPPNQNMPQRYPDPRAYPVRPRLERMDPTEAQAINGRYEVMGPEVLEGLGGRTPDEIAVPAYMQVQTVSQAPEGVDVQFSRAALVIDPRKGDKVEYYGQYSLAEKPPIRPYSDVAGVGDEPVAAPSPSNMSIKILAVLAIGAGVYALARRKSKRR